MKRKSSVKKALDSFWAALRNPNDCLSAICRNKIKPLIVVTFLYSALGAALNYKWKFPRFFEFVFCFYFIGVLGLWAITYYSKKIKRITAALADQPTAKKANAFFFRYCAESDAYIICPLLIVLAFGIGGCSMFGAMEITPTLIWVLILFFFVVYISIIGYLQYVVLAIYIHNLAQGSGDFRKLPKATVGCIPAQLDWLQDLTKLSHTYRSSFFTLGSAYILAFGAFCWLPEMLADTTSIAFYALWGIILVVIVSFFPLISILEYRWIKKIVEQLKVCYIKDLTSETKFNPKLNVTPISPSFQRLVQMLCATQIINSRDYPLKSAWATCYAVFLTLLNLSATILTIAQGITTIAADLPQIF